MSFCICYVSFNHIYKMSLYICEAKNRFIFGNILFYRYETLFYIFENPDCIYLEVAIYI